MYSNLGINGLLYLPKLSSTIDDNFYAINQAFSIYYVGGSQYLGGDLKNAQYMYGLIVVIKRSYPGIKSIGRVIIFPESAEQPTITKSYWASGETPRTSGWRKLNGETITP